MSERDDDKPLRRFEELFGPEFGHGKPFDLASLREVLTALGAPHANLPPVVHVAGTNGKGSTIAFMRAIAEAAGLRVHAFTKPHLLRLSERFVVASQPVAEERLAGAAEVVAAISRDITQFDAQAAAAFMLFDETPADLVLLEAGMGGREDSTNVVAWPAASVIAPIGIDHRDVLGNTIADIASHKAGILRRNSPAFVARQAPDAMTVIEAEASRVGAPLFRAGVEWDAYRSHGRLVVQTQSRALDLPLPTLTGAHQIENAGLACAVLLGPTRFTISDDAFAFGITSAHWPARLQPLTRGPLKALAGDAELWLDGGHNAHAAAALRRSLAAMQQTRPARTALIIGMRARKDWRAFVEELAPAADRVVFVPLPEGAPSQMLASAAGDHARCACDLHSAIDAVVSDGAKRILICGSLSLAAAALDLNRLV
ncbi:MAG: bifunctional folylpolyglutamate synthase/dihydrofolate synthase [Hyphomonadaceae bacterium]|nr:bifunctional folylpolyglutamate synthase/dihydrofolate synthase [Hyphomonadaceae bacterium]